jgi:hypothetical protein
MFQKEMHTGLSWQTLKESENFKCLSVYARIILKWIFKKWDERIRNGFIRFGIVTSRGILSPWYLSNYQLLNKLLTLVSFGLKFDTKCPPRQRKTAALNDTILFESPQIKATPFA